MLGNVHVLHDETIVEVRDNNVDAVAVIVKTCMEEAFNEILPTVTLIGRA